MPVNTLERDRALAQRLTQIAEMLTVAERDIEYLDAIQRRGNAAWVEDMFNGTYIEYVDPLKMPLLLARLRAFKQWMSSPSGDGNKTQADVIMQFVRGGT